MLPTRINLLPPDKQIHLHRMIRSEFIRNSLGLLFVVFVVIGIALVGGRFILQLYYFDLAKSLHAVNTQPSDNSMNISVANARIDVAERVMGTYYYWPNLLTDMFNMIPDTVILSKVTIDKTSGVATITGIADTRDALLLLGESLRSIPSVSSVDIPISQLTQQQNISFTIRMTLTF